MEFWRTLGPVGPWVVLAILAVASVIIVNWFRVLRQSKAIALAIDGTLGGFNSTDISVRAQDCICHVIRWSGGRYSRPYIAFSAEIEPSLRAEARWNIGGYLLNLFKSFRVQSDLAFSGTSFRLATDDDASHTVIKGALSSLGETLANQGVFVPSEIPPTLTISPKRNFWMQKLPQGSTVTLERFNVRFWEDTAKMKIISLAFVKFVDDLSKGFRR